MALFGTATLARAGGGDPPTITGIFLNSSETVAAPPGQAGALMNWVYIAGTGFDTATKLYLGNTSESFSVMSPTQIFVAPPTHSAGVFHWRVQNPNGLSTATNADKWTLDDAPTITSISSHYGTSGQTITITGTGLADVDSGQATNINSFKGDGVYFGSTQVSAPNFTNVSDTKLTAIVPTVAVGQMDITVVANAGTSPTSPADLFTYDNFPAVTALSSHGGAVGGGSSLTITGTGFYSAAPTGAVKIGGTSATYTVNSDTQITATVPAHAAGSGYVRVTTPLGASAVGGSSLYTWENQPTITSLSAHGGPTAGGTQITVYGTGFLSATSVSFRTPSGGGTNGTSLTIVSDKKLTIVSPAHAAGIVNVRVNNGAGGSPQVAADLFTYS